MKSEDKIPLIVDGLEQPSQDLLLRLRRLKRVEASLAVSSTFFSTVTFVFIYITACLNQAGFFQKALKERVWTFIEMVSLVVAIACLAMHFVSYLYVRRERDNLLREVDKVIDAEKGGYEKEEVEIIKKHVKKASLIERSAFKLEFLASFIFLVGEVLAVAEIFSPYGLKGCHRLLRIPVTTQGAMDLVALTLIIAAAVLKIVAVDEQRRRDQDTKDVDSQKLGKSSERKKVQFSSYFALPLISCLFVICSTLGKLFQSMENAGTIAVGETTGGTIPVGYIIRATSAFALLILSCINAFSTTCEQAKVSAKLENMRIGKHSPGFKTVGFSCPDLGGN